MSESRGKADLPDTSDRLGPECREAFGVSVIAKSREDLPGAISPARPSRPSADRKRARSISRVLQSIRAHSAVGRGHGADVPIEKSECHGRHLAATQSPRRRHQYGTLEPPEGGAEAAAGMIASTCSGASNYGTPESRCLALRGAGWRDRRVPPWAMTTSAWSTTTRQRPRGHNEWSDNGRNRRDNRNGPARRNRWLHEPGSVNRSIAHYAASSKSCAQSSCWIRPAARGTCRTWPCIR